MLKFGARRGAEEGLSAPQAVSLVFYVVVSGECKHFVRKFKKFLTILTDTYLDHDGHQDS